MDMERAYNHMNWEFVELVILKFGFYLQFVSWIMGCVQEPFFVILIS